VIGTLSEAVGVRCRSACHESQAGCIGILRSLGMTIARSGQQDPHDYFGACHPRRASDRDEILDRSRFSRSLLLQLAPHHFSIRRRVARSPDEQGVSSGVSTKPPRPATAYAYVTPLLTTRLEKLGLVERTSCRLEDRSRRECRPREGHRCTSGDRWAHAGTDSLAPGSIGRRVGPGRVSCDASSSVGH